MHSASKSVLSVILFTYIKELKSITVHPPPVTMRYSQLKLPNPDDYYHQPKYSTNIRLLLELLLREHRLDTLALQVQNEAMAMKALRRSLSRVNLIAEDINNDQPLPRRQDPNPSTSAGFRPTQALSRKKSMTMRDNNEGAGAGKTQYRGKSNTNLRESAKPQPDVPNQRPMRDDRGNAAGKSLSRGRSNNNLREHAEPGPHVPAPRPDQRMTYSTNLREPAVSHADPLSNHSVAKAATKHNLREQAPIDNRDHDPPVQRATSRLSKTKSNSTLRQNADEHAAHKAHIQRTLSKLSTNQPAAASHKHDDDANSSSISDRPPTPFNQDRHVSEGRSPVSDHNHRLSMPLAAKKEDALPKTKHVHFKGEHSLVTATSRQTVDMRVPVPAKDALPRKKSLKKGTKKFPKHDPETEERERKGR